MILSFCLSSSQGSELSSFSSSEGDQLVFFLFYYYYKHINLNLFDAFQFTAIFTEAEIVYPWLIWASSSLLLTLFDMMPVVFNSFLAIWYVKMFQLHLGHIIPQTWNQSFLQKFLVYLMKNGLSKPQSGHWGYSYFWVTNGL